VQNRTAILRNLASEDSRLKSELDDTLAVFLLDSGSCMELCAKQMFLHLNTIKYRLNRINERLGFRVGHLPELLSLYTAVALRRIMQLRDSQDEQ
jgi:DNA-binding PucR family transcriptional regulator